MRCGTLKRPVSLFLRELTPLLQKYEYGRHADFGKGNKNLLIWTDHNE
jgi:hypothetical protein